MKEPGRLQSMGSQSQTRLSNFTGSLGVFRNPLLKHHLHVQGEYVIVLFIKNSSKSGDFPGGPVAHCVLPVQRVQVQSLVRELDPTLLHGTAKKKK